jgi:hypothetical protein
MSIHSGIEVEAILSKTLQVNNETDHAIEENLRTRVKIRRKLDTTMLPLFSATRIPLVCNSESHDEPFTYNEVARKLLHQARRANFRLKIFCIANFKICLISPKKSI